MKLHKASVYLKQLNNVFDRVFQDCNFVSNLCDVLTEIEFQEEKYNKIRSKIINKYYKLQEGEEYVWNIEDPQNIPFAQKEMNDLENLEFIPKKYTANKPDGISPRELQCLKEFFEFL